MIMFLITSCCPLQVYMLETGGNARGKRYYIKDIHNHYKDVIGVWKWEDGDDFFEITLAKFEKSSYPEKSKRYRDKIFGKYKFVKKGKVIAEVKDIKPLPDFVLSLHYAGPTKYRLLIRDIISGKSKQGEMNLVNDTLAKITLKDIGGIRLKKNNKKSKEFTLPIEILLTRGN